MDRFPGYRCESGIAIFSWESLKIMITVPLMRMIFKDAGTKMVFPEMGAGGWIWIFQKYIYPVIFWITSLGAQICLEKKFCKRVPAIQLRTFKPSWEHSRGSTKFLSQNLRQIGLGVPEQRSDMQTNKQGLLLFICRYQSVKYPHFEEGWKGFIVRTATSQFNLLFTDNTNFKA